MLTDNQRNQTSHSCPGHPRSGPTVTPAPPHPHHIMTKPQSVEVRKKPIFTTALIAGDCVILDAIAKAGLLNKIDVRGVEERWMDQSLPSV